jgi:hypothetical protein
MRARLPAALILTWTVVASPAPSAALIETPAPVLVELFTSEGCSSCPPADQLLSELVRTQPVSTAMVVALSEHVDYWDHQGWKDPFSNAIFTRRQSAHAGSATSGVYTPQVVVDGGPAVVGSDRAAVLRAIRTAAARPKAPIGVSWPLPDRTSLAITAAPDRRLSHARFVVAITEDDLRSSVTRGENEGRELKHDAVTRSWIEAGQADVTGAFQKTVPVRFDRRWSAAGVRVVVFAESTRGAVVALSSNPR